jgi:NADH-quinone oxidoreductase subunit H
LCLSETGLIVTLLSILFLLFIALTERKVFAYVMRRVGPVLMGRNGAFQIGADLIKCVSKELFFIPRPTAALAPFFIALMWTSQLWFAQNFVWGPSMFIFENVDSMILYHLVLILFGNIFFAVVGLLSQSRYAIIGTVRGLVHVISLDMFVTVVYSLLVLTSHSANFHDFILFQNTYWFIFIYAPAASGFVVILFLESKRAPFDHSETEAEVVAGYSTEYNGIMLLMFFLAEYLHLVISAIHFIIFFTGGWIGLNLFSVLPILFLSYHEILI